MIAKKRILFIMPALPGGGAEKVLTDILQNFDYSSYDVSLLLEYKEGVYLDQISKKVRILSLYSKDNLWFQRTKRYSHIFHCFGLTHAIIFKGKIRKLLKVEYYDTIVSFMEGEAVKLHSYILDKGDRNISWVHINLETKHWSLESFANTNDEENAYSRMDEVITVSSDAKDAFSRLFPAKQSNVSVIYNLIDRNIIQSRAAEQCLADKYDRPVICAIGRLNKQKKFDRALEALKILKDRGLDCEIWILGEGELKDELKAMARSLGVDKNVRFLGFNRNPYPYIAASDIFLNSSDSEGYPLTICEAVCLGKAIVATDITGSHEILYAARTGILVEKTPDGIADAIERLLTVPDLKKSLENKAMAASYNFDVQKTMAQIYSVL